MADGGIRQGPAREFIFDGIQLDPAEGSELAYALPGRSGVIHTAGNGVAYGESNPHSGYINQDVSVDADTFKKLKAIQNAGRFCSVAVTTAGNELLIGKMAIGNSDALENANGVVSLELQGPFSIK